MLPPRSKTSVSPTVASGVSAEQTLLLLTAPLSKDLPARHIASIRHLCVKFQQGFTLESLPTVRKILEVVLHDIRTSQSSPFVLIACDLLRLLSIPFVRLHTSDDLSLGGNISGLLQVVGQCLQQDVPAVVQSNAAALFTDFVNNVQLPTATSAASAASNLDKPRHIRLLADTQIAGAVVAALKNAIGHQDSSPAANVDFSIAAIQSSTQSADLNNNQQHDTNAVPVDVLAALLQAAVAFSSSKHLSAQLLSAGVMQPIAVVLNRGGVHDHHTVIAVEVLWNLLETSPQSEPALPDSLSATNSTLSARRSQLPPMKAVSGSASRHSSTKHNGGNEGALQGRHDTAVTADIDTDDCGMLPEAACSTAPWGYSEQDSMQGILGSATEAASATGSDQYDGHMPAQLLSQDEVGAASSEGGAEADAAIEAECGALDAVDIEGNKDTAPQVDADSRASSQSAIEADDHQQQLSSMSASSLPDDSNGSQSADGTEAATAADAEADAAVMTDAEADTNSSDSADANGVEESVEAGIVRVFADCLENGYSTVDKELQNTVLVVASLLAQGKRSRGALCCDHMLQQLLIVSTEPELGDCSTAYLKASSQSIDANDCELRQLAWTCMAQLLQHNSPSVNSLAYSFVRVLLMYIQPGDGYEKGPLHWSKPQLATLRQAALGLLYSMAPCFPQAYNECGGPAQMLEFLAGCSDSKLLEAGLHHMHRACSCSALLCSVWGAEGSMELALAVAADTTWSERVRRIALLLVSVLCRGSSEAAHHFLQLEGIACLCLELEKLKQVGNEPGTLYDFAVLDALWSGIVRSSTAMQSFLLADGLGSLLDVLDCGAAALKPLLLTIAADVVGSECGKHAKATDMLYDWMSSKQQSACHIILDLWRQQESGKGIFSPGLSPRSKRAPAFTGSSSDDLYMKIHAVFAQLGFTQVSAHVDLPDQATLCAVEHFIALQQGLVWQNMAAKFAAEGFDPTEEDQARIKAGIEQAVGVRQTVTDKQQMLLQEHAAQLMQAELDFVRAKKWQDERDAEARRYHKDTSTLSVKERLAAKAKREQMLLDSFNKEEEPMFEDELVMEAFSRRPSHVAQHDILERLSCSPSPGARSAVELLLRQQYPEQKIEARTHSPKALKALYSFVNRDERPLSEPTGLEGNEADYDDLQRDSGSDDSDEEDFDSD